MNYADYKKHDFINGIGLRNSLFVSGCHHACKGCFNAVAWSFNYGKPFTLEMEDMVIADLQSVDINISGLSLLGGEPFEHAGRLLRLVKRVKEECDNKDIWCWSGFTFEEIMQDQQKREMLAYIDVLIDGRFEIEQKDLTLKFRGSSNQRIINVKESIEEGKVILFKH